MIEEAYHAYLQTEKVMMYGVKGSIKYDIDFCDMKVKVATESVIEEMRKHPEFK